MWKLLWWMALQLVPPCGRCKEAGHRTGSKLPITRLSRAMAVQQGTGMYSGSWIVHTKKETKFTRAEMCSTGDCLLETWHAVFQHSASDHVSNGQGGLPGALQEGLLWRV